MSYKRADRVYVLFCGGLLSLSLMFLRFIQQLVVCSFLLLGSNSLYVTAYLSVLPLMDIWAVSSFGLL